MKHPQSSWQIAAERNAQALRTIDPRPIPLSVSAGGYGRGHAEIRRLGGKPSLCLSYPDTPGRWDGLPDPARAPQPWSS